jgi:hypothetical protein
MKLSNMCLGTRWWCYGGMEELNGVRFRLWQRREDGHPSQSLSEREQQKLRDTYGDGRVSEGEEPGLLALVPEGNGVEFEII